MLDCVKIMENESENKTDESLTLEDSGLDNKKRIRAWCLYDWANSAFATTVMAGFFPAFFSNFYGRGLTDDTIIFCIV